MGGTRSRADGVPGGAPRAAGAARDGGRRGQAAGGGAREAAHGAAAAYRGGLASRGPGLARPGVPRRGVEVCLCAEGGRDVPAPVGLSARSGRIRPSWKSGGPVDYSPDLRVAAPAATAPLPLFQVATSGGTAIQSGGTVRSLATSLEALGLSANDLDEESRLAMREMLSWRLASVKAAGPVTALLAFSFGGARVCTDLRRCPEPGPTNELLAATVERFVAGSAQAVEVYAQWEIAAALLRSGRVPAERVHAAGAPGVYLNTARILEEMTRDLAGRPLPGGVAVLAHPDHLRRAFLTVRTMLPSSAAAAIPTSAVVPAMSPYGLDWPTFAGEGSSLNLYRGVAGAVHSHGLVESTGWYSGGLGYFPDGETQEWVGDRDVWLLYDHWAMAQGIATGLIKLDKDPPAGFV